MKWKRLEFTKTYSIGEYDYVRIHDHHSANDSGFVLKQRVVMENKLKRFLSSNEVVHHINFNKRDNRIANLALLTRSEHTKLHAKLMGRYVKKLTRCKICNKNFWKRRRTQKFCSRICSKKSKGLSSFNGGSHWNWPEKLTVSRPKFRKLLWSHTKTSLGKRFGVSAVTIDTWGKKLGITMPRIGHWKKKNEEVRPSKKRLALLFKKHGTRAKVSRVLNVSCKVIRRWQREFGL